MSRLQTPVKHVLRNVTTPASVARMWNRIDAKARVDAPQTRHRFAFATALLVLVAGVLGLAVWRAAPPSATLAKGPLLQADGSPLPVVRANEGASTLALSDGSTMVLDRGAAIEPLETSAAVVLLRQLHGTVLYDIKAGGPRRWTIECGIATVEVIGTSFRVERTESLVRVEVMRGTVLVRGDRVPERVAQLTAGMKLDVVATPPTEPSAPEPPASGAAPPSSPPRAAIAPAPDATTGWRELARRGDNATAYAELGSAGVARAARSAAVDDLLSLADVARLAGHPADAAVPLERIVTEHPADSRASLAAFTLGRVRLDSLHAPAAAARTFEKAIALGLPGGLAEDAYVRLAEARAKAGDDAGAKAAYVEYVKRFPNGTRRAELHRWSPFTTDTGP